MPDVIRGCSLCGKERRVFSGGALIPSMSAYIPEHYFDCICGIGNEEHYRKRDAYHKENQRRLSEMSKNPDWPKELQKIIERTRKGSEGEE